MHHSLKIRHSQHEACLGKKYLLILTAWLVYFGSTMDSPCKFEGYIASCTVSLMNNIPIEITIIINHCHKPIDITFMLKSYDPPLDWKYTFVTTNHVENLELPSLSTVKSVTLHIEMVNDNGKELDVEADFHVDDQQDAIILDTSVPILTYDDCNFVQGQGGRIALGVLITVLLLGLCGTILAWLCRKRTSSHDSLALVDDMEVGMSSPSSHPLSPGAISTVSSRSQDYNVEYRLSGTVSIIEANREEERQMVISKKVNT